ncbi:hypothetical protein L6164_030753 [Bauhinia variegata]|uniref:Uncharacterized protein n=1 Tax=Bauhinia variegata TaxID=167791 RepID=A0ACB9LE64_BAUVA|nr:hypothetical protein L6164_030753 [Bauhinia variegata]
MAFSPIFGKSTSSLRPIVGQLLKTQRIYHSVIFAAMNHDQATLSRKTDDHNWVEEIPSGFPFEIRDIT